MILAKSFLRRDSWEEWGNTASCEEILEKSSLQRDSSEETWSFYPVSDVPTTLTATLQFFTDGGLYTESLSNGHYP